MPTHPTTTDTDPSRNARLGVRLSEAHKRLIEQAAAVHGQTVSDFAVSSLVQLAQRVVDEANVTRLSARDRDRFLDLLAADAEPNADLRAAADRFKAARG